MDNEKHRFRTLRSIIGMCIDLWMCHCFESVRCHYPLCMFMIFLRVLHVLFPPPKPPREIVESQQCFGIAVTRLTTNSTSQCSSPPWYNFFFTITVWVSRYNNHVHWSLRFKCTPPVPWQFVRVQLYLSHFIFNILYTQISPSAN